MNCSVEFTKEAEKDISVLDKIVIKRIIEKLEWLSGNFDFIFHMSHELTNTYSHGIYQF